MQHIIDYINPASGDADGTMLFGAMFFIFMCMFFFVLAVTDMVQRRRDIRKRTVFERGLMSDGIAPEQEWEVISRSLRFQSVAGNNALLARVERGSKSGTRESEKSKLRRELTGAGYFGASAVSWFQGIRLTMLVAFPLAMHFVLQHMEIDPAPATRLALLLSAAGVAYLLPGRYLAARKRQLRQQCREGFPDFMDLMIICVEAGLSPRAAIDRISREISHNYPYLGANLYLMSLELRAGATLAEAVGNLASRTELEEVISLGALLTQTEQLGTSIGEALRVYSEEMRDKRMSRAEEKAHSLPVKLVLPLGFYVFPVMLVVIALPIVLRIRAALF